MIQIAHERKRKREPEKLAWQSLGFVLPEQTAQNDC